MCGVSFVFWVYFSWLYFFLNCYSINEILEILCIFDVVYLDNGGVCFDNILCLEIVSFF